ncbi:hypothetical protein [Pararhodonellum marinum]|uniref:hypothetical protein n=1 Tax=Pararhodonellum marinum TaxID=2755358 RepID=UPI00188E8F2A|nr:hypothetical protein [Pararhodonellum marinum]
MKTLCTLLCLSILTLMTQYSHAQNDSIVTSLERSLKNSLLSNIKQKTDSMDNQLGAKLSDLDARIQQLDKSLNQSNTESQRIEKLVERVKLIEDVQEAEKLSELNIYQGNYQAAIINLVSMERELRPLLLFGATRDFFTTLESVGNPSTYPGFNEWYNGYKEYVEENKTGSASLGVVSNLMSLTGDLSAGTPIFGTFSQALFTGMSSYIDNINGKKNLDLKLRSQKMFELVTELGQYTHEIHLVETEWAAIDAELEELKRLYEINLQKNLDILGVKKVDFDKRYSLENDANKRYEYLNQLTDTISKRVSVEKSKNPKNWKNTFYYEMSEVQALKIRFGTITFRIRENISKYNELISKYKNSRQMGSKIAELENKLNGLQNSFDKAYNPLDYINSANKMYKVN